MTFGEYVAVTVLLATPVVLLLYSLTPKARRRRKIVRARMREIRGRMRQSTLQHPMAFGITATRVFFLLLSFPVFGMVAQNRIEWDTDSPGFWLPLFFTAMGLGLFLATAIPLLLGLVDHLSRKTFLGTVVDKISDTYEGGDGEGSFTVNVDYAVIEGDGMPRRPYQIRERLAPELAIGDQVRISIAPRSGYVYAIAKLDHPAEVTRRGGAG